VCSGEYQSDRVHGVGAYYFTNGQVYEGRWENGRKAGPLVYTVETQQCFAAEFDHLTLLWCVTRLRFARVGGGRMLVAVNGDGTRALPTHSPSIVLGTCARSSVLRLVPQV
jgi:hypothetical protein